MQEKKTKKSALDNLTPEQRSAAGRLGGIKSQEVQKEKRTFRKIYDSVLMKGSPKSVIAAVRDEFGDGVDEDLTVKAAIACVTVSKALKGDLKAVEHIRDTIGEKPALDLNISGSISLEAPEFMEKLTLDELRALAALAKSEIEADGWRLGLGGSTVRSEEMRAGEQLAN